MKIKVISDTHNDHSILKSIDLESDILIHCGDFGTKGNFTEAQNFLYWFVKQPAKYKILVPGNHDKKIKTHSELQSLSQDLGIHLLMNREISIKGLKIYGAHYVPYVTAKIGYTDSSEVRKEKWKDIPKNLDILITHGPPFGILDINKHGQHIGCDELLLKVKEQKPKYHVFGHLHEMGGLETQVFNTIFLNCANKDENYLMSRIKPMEIDL